MKIEVNVQKKYFFILLGAILIIGAGIFGYAFNSGANYANPSSTSDVGYKNAAQAASFGHTADETNVKINGQVITLQDAINQGLFGGGGSGSIVVCGGWLNRYYDTDPPNNNVRIVSGSTWGCATPTVVPQCPNGYDVINSARITANGGENTYLCVLHSAGGSGVNSGEFTRPYGFEQNGTYSWTVPAGVSRVMVEVWGGGGGGGCTAYSNGISSGGGGGGSGGYSRSVINVVSGQTYNIVVGTGGKTCPGVNGQPFVPDYGQSAGDGSLSSFSGNGFLVKAYPGRGGASSYNGYYSNGITDRDATEGHRVTGTGGLGGTVAPSNEGNERLAGINGQDADNGCGDFGEQPSCGALSAYAGISIRPAFKSDYGAGGIGAGTAGTTSTRQLFGGDGQKGAVLIYMTY